MLRTFYFGILCGVLAAAGVAWFVPVVDQHREPSLVLVEANGGNREAFHINLPQDRILAGMAGPEALPAELQWPASGGLAEARAELFKIRDANDVVVGVASRISGPGAAESPVVEWTLHLPARGSLYATMQPAAGNDGYRSGALRAGTREFAARRGSVTARRIDLHERRADGLDVEQRIELVTALVSSSTQEATE